MSQITWRRFARSARESCFVPHLKIYGAAHGCIPRLNRFYRHVLSSCVHISLAKSLGMVVQLGTGMPGCLRRLWGIKWYQLVPIAEIRRVTHQPLQQSKLGISPCSVILHEWTKCWHQEILAAFPAEHWRRPPGRRLPVSHGWRQFLTISSFTSWHCLKQLIYRSGDSSYITYHISYHITSHHIL